jgi:hypothetical protein
MVKTLATVFAVCAGCVAVFAGPGLRSATLAKQLTALLTERRLEAIAAQDPDEPDRFVAALFVPGAQLLVVSARYPSPALLQTRLVQKQYRDVYLDLQGAAVPNTSWFLQDMNADGLSTQRDQVSDVLYSGTGVTATVFDGDWKKHGRSEHEYEQLLSATDERYSRLLAVLLRQLHGT